MEIKHVIGGENKSCRTVSSEISKSKNSITNQIRVQVLCVINGCCSKIIFAVNRT